MGQDGCDRRLEEAEPPQIAIPTNLQPDLAGAVTGQKQANFGWLDGKSAQEDSTDGWTSVDFARTEPKFSPSFIDNKGHLGLGFWTEPN